MRLLSSASARLSHQNSLSGFILLHASDRLLNGVPVDPKIPDRWVIPGPTVTEPFSGASGCPGEGLQTDSRPTGFRLRC